MKKVMFIGNDRAAETIAKSILGRADIQLSPIQEFSIAVQRLLRCPPDLLLILDSFGTSLPSMLHELQLRYPNAPFPVIVLSPSHDAQWPGIVKASFPIKPNALAFNETIARILRLPTRQSIRLPIRLGASLKSAKNSFVVSSLAINVSGMLVSSFKPLPVGAKLKLRFMGRNSGNHLPALTVKVLRQETGILKDLQTQNYALTFVDRSESEIKAYLDQILPELT